MESCPVTKHLSHFDTCSDSQPPWFILTMNCYHCFVTDQTKETRDETIISHNYPLCSGEKSGLNEANECKNCANFSD